jgi:hypothetical protein
VLTTLAIADGAFTSAKFAADAIGASQLSAAAVAKIEAALLNEGDGQQLIDAIVQAIEAADFDNNLLPNLVRDAILNRVLAGNHDTAGTVGKLLQFLDALVSSRLPAGNVTVGSIVANAISAAAIAVGALNGKGDWSTTAPLDAAGTRSALGLATNNLDTQLTAIGNSAASAASSAGSAASSSSSAAASAGTAVTQTTAGAIRTAVGLASANLDTQLGDIKTDTGNLVTRITSTLFGGITSLKQWLGMLAGKQAGDSTALTEIRATGAGSGTFNPTTDSGEALRDRGDAAWTTGTGGGGGGGGTTVVAGALIAQLNTRTFTTMGGAVQALSIAQSEGKTLVFLAQINNDGDATPYDLTGKTVVFSVFEKADDGEIVFSKSTDDASITLSASDGAAPSVLDQVNVDIDTTDTADKGAWLWELRVTTDDNAYLAGGEWVVRRAPIA